MCAGRTSTASHRPTATNRQDHDVGTKTSRGGSDTLQTAYKRWHASGAGGKAVPCDAAAVDPIGVRSPRKGLIMTHEYDEPITNDAIEDAVRLAVSLRSQRQSASPGELATEAVDATFCSCVTSAADACVPGGSPTHAGLIAEVTRLAQPPDLGSDAISVPSDPIDLASEDSFPASDPPAWIWR
jgi:hypothetical protein